MTAKEIFEQYAGRSIKLRANPGIGNTVWKQGEYYQISGYDEVRNQLVMSRPNGATRGQFSAHTVFCDDLPHDWAGHYSEISYWDWDDLVLPDQSICCRCGNGYKNKKKHREVCK